LDPSLPSSIAFDPATAEKLRYFRSGVWRRMSSDRFDRGIKDALAGGAAVLALSLYPPCSGYALGAALRQILLAGLNSMAGTGFLLSARNVEQEKGAKRLRRHGQLIFKYQHTPEALALWQRLVIVHGLRACALISFGALLLWLRLVPEMVASGIVGWGLAKLLFARQTAHRRQLNATQMRVIMSAEMLARDLRREARNADQNH
jgi:hypothetical protein